MSNDSIRVLYVVQSARMYGSQRCLIDILVGLHGHNIDPIVAIKEEGPLTDALTKIGVPFHIMPLRNWLNNRGRFQSWRKRFLNRKYASKLAQFASAERVDLIHTNTFIVPIGAMAAKRLQIPHVWHAREELRPHRGRVFIDSDSEVRDLVRDTTRIVVTPSLTNRTWLKPYVPESCLRAISDGPFDEDTKQPYVPKNPSSNGVARIAVVGRLGPAKGTEDALRTAAILKVRGIRAEWTFVGAGHEGYSKKILQMAQTLGIEHIVRLTGYQSDVDPYYRNADIVVMPSHAETFGRVTAEALGFGCPIVASRIPATQEIVKEGQTGLLFSRGNAEEMADAIVRLLQNPDFSESIARHGYADVWSRFTRQQHGNQINRIYREAMG